MYSIWFDISKKENTVHYLLLHEFPHCRSKSSERRYWCYTNGFQKMCVWW